MRVLGGRVEREIAAERFGHRNDTSGLHRRGDDPLVGVGLGDVVRRVGECRVDALGIRDQRPDVGAVGAQVLVDDVRVVDRVLEVDHRRERLVVDDDRLDRVGQPVPGRGDHDRDDVALVVGLADHDREMVGALHVLGDGPRARQWSGPGVSQIRARVDRGHPFELQRGGGVDPGDPGVGVGAADAPHPQLPGKHEVVGELGLAGQQDCVLLAQPALADHATVEGVGGILGDSHMAPYSPAAWTAPMMFW